jgi:hypothetical protein
MTSESGPAETPVIVHETVVWAFGPSPPAFTVGEATEKWPFCELSVAETVEKALLIVAPTTVFLIVAVTVAV